jgi:GntR family transcriptional regulator
VNELTEQTVDPSSRLPLYAQLEQIIEGQLTSGELKAGDMLPTEAQLCAQFGVSRPVVRQAISSFVARGRLYRLRGKGTFVSGAPLAERLLRPTLGFFDDLAAAGLEVSNDLVGIAAISAQAGLAEALSVAPGGGCVRIERLRRIDGEVVAFMRSFIPDSLHPRLLARLEQCDFTHVSLGSVLEQATGIRPHSGHRWVQAVVSDAEVGLHLGIAEGVALLYVESVEDDDRGRRIEYSQAWHRGDRTRLELESSRTGEPDH